jgi:hypothetical protein
MSESCPYPLDATLRVAALSAFWRSHQTRSKPLITGKAKIDQRQLRTHAFDEIDPC